DPDVFGIQEGLHHMMMDLKIYLPEYTMIGKGRGGDDRDEYNAVFYKKSVWTLKGYGQFWLSKTPDVPGSVDWNSACPRICTWAILAFSADPKREFALFNTHLDHESRFAQKEGIKLICLNMEHILQKELPVVLMGDFNCEPGNDVVK